MENNKITFVIPSRNNLEFLQLAYQSIRNLKTKHEILVLNDASTDGTQEWIDSLNDKDLIVHYNPGPERIGIVGMFDKGIEMARTEIIFAFHADMVAAPDLDKHILKHLEKGTVVSATRVEPPLHPGGPEKIIQDFGSEVEDFNINKFYDWCGQTKFSSGQVTEGIFAPWCMYKEDFLSIGGHDELFAPQSREDSDLFNRFHLVGYKFKQPWDALVYHFTSRGSRFNKHAGGAPGQDSEEWKYTNTKNMRNFVRKWGTLVKHDDLMKPQVPPKYDVGFILKNADSNILAGLEPWCDNIYVDPKLIESYIEIEKNNTILDLHKRIKPYDNEKQNGILVEIDRNKFTGQDYHIIENLSEIIQDSGEEGEFELGNLKITIISLETYEKKLINEKYRNNR